MTHRGPFQPLPFCDSVITVIEKTASVHLWQRGVCPCPEHTGSRAFCWFLQQSIGFFVACVTAPLDTRRVRHSPPQQREVSSFSCDKSRAAPPGGNPRCCPCRDAVGPSLGETSTETSWWSGLQSGREHLLHMKPFLCRVWYVHTG